jgi:Fe-Mn family superoxide dismutase
MSIELPPLPYSMDALAPHLSAETLGFHHGKHHRAYVDSVNAAVAGTHRDTMTLEEIVGSAGGTLFNSAAQAWNHAFYWNSMRPGGGGEPAGVVAAAIRGHFGSFGDFRRLFKDAALAQFGSGWTWLVKDGGRLLVTSTANADLPMNYRQKALLACDVWEHAYYIDYRNARGTYVDVFLDHLVNWDWVAGNLD